MNPNHASKSSHLDHAKRIGHSTHSNSDFNPDISDSRSTSSFKFDRARISQPLFKLKAKLQGIPVRVLLDCGASRSFVDSKFVQNNQLISKDQNRNIQLRLGDDSTLSTSEKLVDSCLQLPKFPDMPITLTDISLPHGVDILLGMPWFKECNPNINWITHSLQPSEELQDSSNEDNTELHDAIIHSPAYNLKLPISKPATDKDMLQEWLKEAIYSIETCNDHSSYLSYLKDEVNQDEDTPLTFQEFVFLMNSNWADDVEYIVPLQELVHDPKKINQQNTLESICS